MKPKRDPAPAQAKPKAPQTGPDGQPETPKQKVERLRAQARAARMAQSSSGIDRWLDVGRKFANRAHKGMVYSLIAASGMCWILCLPGCGDILALHVPVEQLLVELMLII